MIEREVPTKVLYVSAGLGAVSIISGAVIATEVSPPVGITMLGVGIVAPLIGSAGELVRRRFSRDTVSSTKSQSTGFLSGDLRNLMDPNFGREGMKQIEPDWNDRQNP